MEQRISLVTLGVADVERAFEFYRQLGWAGQLVEGTVFFQTGGIGVVLWDNAELASDAGLEPFAGGGFRGVALAHNVRDKSDVDAAIADAQSAGGTAVRAAADTFYGGYAGYFADLDGHVWEVAYNPGFELAADGSITIPDFDDL